MLSNDSSSVQGSTSLSLAPSVPAPQKLIIQDCTLPHHSWPDRFSERTGQSGAEQGIMGKERDAGEKLRGRGISPAGMGIWETSSLKCIANMKKLLGVVGPGCPVHCWQWILFSLLRVACVAVGEIWVWLKLFFLLLGCLESLLPPDGRGTQCGHWLMRIPSSCHLWPAPAEVSDCKRPGCEPAA